MNAQEIIAKHINKKIGEQKPGICAICGAERNETLSITKAGNNFNNFDLMRYPSKRICVYCASCLCDRLRRTNFIATEHELIEFKRDDIIKHLFNPPDLPFVFCITRSYKKQNAVRARLNYSREQFYVRIEEEELLFEPAKARGLCDDMTELLTVFNKGEIRSGDYRQKRIQEFGFHRLLEIEQRIKLWRGHPVFELILYALIDTKQQKGNTHDRPEPATDLFS